MKAVRPNAMMRTHLFAFILSIHSLVFMTFYYLQVKQSFPISRAGRRTAYTGKVFGGKYRSRARMIFPETPGA